MASLILRPVASKGYVASTVPAGTAIEEVYKLVNEEVTDSAVTTFVPGLHDHSDSSTLISSNAVVFKYELPENTEITSLSEIRVYVSKSSSESCSQCPVLYSNNEQLCTTQVWHVSDGSDWAVQQAKVFIHKSHGDGSIDTTETTFESYWEDMRSALNNGDFGIACWTMAKKNAPSVSQIYIELICEYKKAGTPLYFKQNGEWAELSGTVFQKTNGTWEEADGSVLAETEYPLEEVI